MRDTIGHLSATERGDRLADGQNQSVFRDCLHEDLIREDFAVDQGSIAVENDGLHGRVCRTSERPPRISKEKQATWQITRGGPAKTGTYHCAAMCEMAPVLAA